jgi:GxxExxY protein
MLPDKADALTGEIIAAAIEVHRDKGPGLLESVYEWCLTCELELRGLTVETQRTVPIRYKRFVREDVLRFDLLVEGRVLVECKAVARILPIHQAQLLSYMKLLCLPTGLLINFNTVRLKDGISRLVLPEQSSQMDRPLPASARLL